MTKKDYILIAGVLASGLKCTDIDPYCDAKDVLRAMVEGFVHVLEAENPQFNPDTFRQAAMG